MTVSSEGIFTMYLGFAIVAAIYGALILYIVLTQKPPKK